MTRTSLQKHQAVSIPHAIELCLEVARKKKNFSVDRVADGMGLANKWIIYKWMESGRLPALMIRPLEQTCGADFVTRYLGHAAHKLLIDIPTGRSVKPVDINVLHASFSQGITLLLSFYEGVANQAETIAALNQLMEGVAWHHKNVEQHSQPQLDLCGDDNE
ncbi:hypothetical protein Q4519_08820 [Motilimonas sp. 1_MG-2023]|uniref:hypothetical protein n=1 Tax=Motilimonas sp. 1_MG-2023 TaxID=3062672 RepID=UPI0026E3668F|nr:hypothetical protein [Motilimonas sp. 1_MG-2023]MDO6525786.1 hypothetical protein [Motilimonas sp. 1_MG-2023]